MVKLRTPPPLVVSWRPDARSPLVLIHVVDFHMYRLGLSRIVGVDPHGAYAGDAGMSHLALQLQSLIGRAYSTLEEAANPFATRFRYSRFNPWSSNAVSAASVGSAGAVRQRERATSTVKSIAIGGASDVKGLYVEE